VDFGNLEKITHNLFKYEFFSLDVECNFGGTNSNKSRKDALYYYEYNSSKYSNLKQVGNLKLNISKYLIFSYNDFKNKAREDLYLSLFEIYDLKDVAKELVKRISNKSKYFAFKENDNEIIIKNNYKNKLYKAECIHGKTIGFQLTVVEFEDGSQCPGVNIYFNDPSTMVTLDYIASKTLFNIIIELNLLETSERLTLMGYLYQLSSRLEINDENKYNYSVVNEREHYISKPIITKRSMKNLKSNLNNNQEDENDIGKE
jgi:hypothetical protein